MKATFVKNLGNQFRGDARLYQVDPPVSYRYYNDECEEITKHADHVIVSAVHAMFSGAETYIFPATADGLILNWGELDGSFRGELDHAKALRNAGYELV